MFNSWKNSPFALGLWQEAARWPTSIVKTKAGVLCNTAGYKNALFLCELVQNVSVLGLVLLQGHSCAVTHALARQHPTASFAGDEIPTSLGRRVLGVCSWGKACTDNEKQKRSLPNFLSPKIRP